jgi:RNA polymerase sigma factor (TIGR02999 family)
VTPITALLDRLKAGDPRAAGELFDRAYDELKRMAAGQAAGDDASPTELVHEAFLRLFPIAAPAFTDRAYFFAAAATAMRRVRVDRARAANARKRGGGRRRIDLDSGIAGPEPDLDLVALDEALDKLAARDPDRAKLVELRFFAGLSMPRVAEVLGVSLATAERRWAFARAWLLAELGSGTE